MGRVVAMLRVWLGLEDPSENRLHPAHGWLLPPLEARAVPARTTIRRAEAGASGRRG